MLLKTDAMIHKTSLYYKVTGKILRSAIFIIIRVNYLKPSINDNNSLI